MQVVGVSVSHSQVAGLCAVLESDFRQLAVDARKSEGFASFFSNADNQPEVKESAERAVMKVRQIADHPNAMDQIRHSKELLKPLQLSCDTKSARLVSQSLATVQKMVSNEALSAEGAEAVIGMLSKVEKMGDEGVQLKVLQTSLTLLQSPLHPTTEDNIATVLGICFRLLSHKGRKDTVASTAAATVRQSVAIVFTYVDVPAERDRLLRLEARQQAQQTQQAAADANQFDPPSSALLAAQRLLEDLIAIATGAPPTWLKTPSLPRTFILEVLDFALTNSSELFTSLPDFQSALSLRIAQLLQSQLQDYLDAGASGAPQAAASFPAFKATLRCMRTLLVRYHTQLAGRCGTLVQTLLKGLGPLHLLPQRIAIAQLVRHIMEDAPLVYYLFISYDMQRERKLDAVHALVRGVVDIIDSTLKGGSGVGLQGGEGEEDPADAIGAMFQARSDNKDWNLDSDYETAAPGTQSAYLAMLAVDGLLHFMTSVEALTFAATEGEGQIRGSEWYALSPRERMMHRPSPGSIAVLLPPPPTVQREACVALVDRSWRATLAVLNQLLARSNRDTVVLLLLRGYQRLTQACGILELSEPRNAFLEALCQLALAGAGGGELTGRAAGAISPRGGAAGSKDALYDGDNSPRGSGRDTVPGLGSPRGSLGLIAGGGGGGNDELDAGVVLTTKNIQAMRTLFNIAHRLANVLGPGWTVVLETLHTLDRALDNPRTTTQEAAPGMAGGPAESSDLAILSAAASQLFECTQNMSREAVVSLLSGLRDVSMEHLPHATQVSQPKMFALLRMVEVLQYNAHRIYDLWGIFLAHVLELVNDPKPPVRGAAIDALGRAILGALGSLPPVSSPQASPLSLNLPASPSGGDSTGGLEHMLLVALEALHNDDRERDVRAGVLRVLLSVLQRHGERLTDGWTPVFRLLAVVPGQHDPDLMSAGFQCLQLITTDYMPAMPFPRLKRCLEVVVAYGKQQTDVNVSLTSISLLWNVGDMLSRSGGAPGHRRGASFAARAERASEEGEDDAATSPGRAVNQLVAVTTTAQAEELLELSFSALQALSQDARPEVRNSGARTLFAVVVTQGPRLSRRLWERSLWELLFPLLRHSFHMSATSSKEESEATLLGRSKGAQVRLVMHHSRNTEQKQWDETVVVAVGGMSRLLRAHLPAIAAMEGIEAGWEELMLVAEGSLAGGRKEVAVAAVGLLGSVLGAHGEDDTVVTPAMWRRALRTIDVGVEAATSAGCCVPISARMELVGLVGSLCSSLQNRFSDEEMEGVFRWTEAFCRNPWSEDDATNPVQTIGMPPVQKAALALLPALAPVHRPQLWHSYVSSIVRLLQPHHVVAAWREQEEAAAAAAELANREWEDAGGEGEAPGSSGTAPAPPAGLGATPGPLGTGANGQGVAPPLKQAQHRFALNSACLEKVLAALEEVYTAAPLWVRAATLADLAEGLGRCMELRFTVYQEKLWRSAAGSFNRLVPLGVAAIAQSTSASPGGGVDVDAATARAWLALALAFENFLLAERYQRDRARADDHGKGAQHGSSSAQQSPRAHLGPHPHPELPLVPILDVPSTKQAVASPRKAAKGRKGKAAAAITPPQSAAGSGKIAPPAPEIDPQQGRVDAELELSVLDTLADGVLPGCASAPLPMKQRLVAVVDRGIARPRNLSIPQLATGSNFSHVCVRKMYVLCSRGGGADADAAALQVARLALPMFLSRADAMLRTFAEETRPGSLLRDGTPVSRPRLDEVMCVLEVVASMTLAPPVVDSVLPPDEPVTAIVRVLRARPEMHARGRERTHLLLLYGALCGCVNCKEPRVREMVSDVLNLAGAELGLGNVNAF